MYTNVTDVEKVCIYIGDESIHYNSNISNILKIEQNYFPLIKWITLQLFICREKNLKNANEKKDEYFSRLRKLDKYHCGNHHSLMQLVFLVATSGHQ